MARRFPIGIQTFAKIRENNAIYIDKTDLIYKLAHEGCVYFLSRPRRFGKSLLIDTMNDYFLVERNYSKGLLLASWNRNGKNIRYFVLTLVKKNISPRLCLTNS